MTKQCEEKLIADVAETKALLLQFMKEIKPTLATHQEVVETESKISDHIDNHKESRGLAPLWAAIVLDAVLTLGCAFWRK